jgi:hypothetical protein
MSLEKSGFTHAFDDEGETWGSTKLVDFHELSPIKNVDFLHALMTWSPYPRK